MINVISSCLWLPGFKRDSSPWKPRGKPQAESCLNSSAAPACVSSMSLGTALAAAGENQRVFWEAASVDLPPQLCPGSPHTLPLFFINVLICFISCTLCGVLCLTVVFDMYLRGAVCFHAGDIQSLSSLLQHFPTTVQWLCLCPLKFRFLCFVMVCSACDSAFTHLPRYLQVITPHMTQLGLLHQTLMWSLPLSLLDLSKHCWC